MTKEEIQAAYPYLRITRQDPDGVMWTEHGWMLSPMFATGRRLENYERTAIAIRINEYMNVGKQYRKDMEMLWETERALSGLTREELEQKVKEEALAHMQLELFG
ncbi:MAG: hypothetical protein K9L21_05115 [Spirochaetia bacterium]|nr:hypothetical protein [Spirochaetia bacterium]